MTVTLPAVKLLRTGRMDQIAFDLPKGYQAAVWGLVQKAEKKGDYLQVRLGLPQRPRSTGFRSQNSRLHGHCENLAEQIVDVDPDSGVPIYTAEEIKEAMKRMSVVSGYPTRMSVDGREEPLPTRYSSQEQMQIVLDVINRFADEHNYWLVEIDEETKLPYRSIGGRSKKEMEEYTE